MTSGTTPVRLGALSTIQTRGAKGATPPPPNPDGPFGASPFKPMRLLTLSDDHVVAAVDGSIGEYAIGHLPPSVRSRIVAPGSISASVANAQKRTSLGILAEKAIDDLHDPDPLICPVALAVIRHHARDAERTILCYLATASLANMLHGQEFTTTGESLVYRCSERTLNVEWRGTDWSLSPGRLEIEAKIPATACIAAVGTPLDHLVDHPVFNEGGGVVTGIRPEEWGTEILFETRPIRAIRLPEAAKRRRR